MVAWSVLPVMRALKYLLVVVIVIVAVVAAVLASGAASADDPGGIRPPFPFAELAAEAALTMSTRISVRETVTVRMRPALDWPVRTVVRTGQTIVGAALTPGEDPWLQVRCCNGRDGWIRAADVGVPAGLLARLPVRSAPPIEAELAGYRTAIHARPGGPELDFSLSRDSFEDSEDRRYPVLGRSADEEWIALRFDQFHPPILWVRASALRQIGGGIEVEALPVFVGSGVAVVRSSDPSGAPQFIGAGGRHWLWTPESALVGLHGASAWRYDPGSGASDSVALPTRSGWIAPDGRHVWSETCPGGDWSRCHQVGRDVVLTSVVDGNSRTVPRIYAPAPSDAPATGRNVWSPGGSWLLFEFSARGEGEPARQTTVSVTGATHFLPSDGSYTRYFWLSDGSLGHWRDEALVVSTPMGEQIRRIEVGSSRGSSTSRPGGPLLSVRTDDGWVELNYATGQVSPMLGADRWDERTSIVWAPGGSRAFIALGSLQPFIYEAATGRMTTISGLPAPNDETPDWKFNRWFRTLRWAPTNDRFLVTVRDHGAWLVELDAGASTARPLPGVTLADGICSPATVWSPDGQRFAAWSLRPLGGERFTSDGLAGLPATAMTYVHVNLINWWGVYDAEGALLLSFRSGFGSHGADLRWSPDGRWIAIGGTRAVGCV